MWNSFVRKAREWSDCSDDDDDYILEASWGRLISVICHVYVCSFSSYFPPPPLPPYFPTSPHIQVRVVQHKQSKTLYALKYINKAKCVKMKAVANIVQERRLLEEVSWRRYEGRGIKWCFWTALWHFLSIILLSLILGSFCDTPFFSVCIRWWMQTNEKKKSQIDHPFVVNLRYAFQDDENCFFVLDLMLGGDLRCEGLVHLSINPTWQLKMGTLLLNLPFPFLRPRLIHCRVEKMIQSTWIEQVRWMKKLSGSTLQS